ncbi:hypothetical protein [Spongorhabdus nitratireducens]
MSCNDNGGFPLFSWLFTIFLAIRLAFTRTGMIVIAICFLIFSHEGQKPLVARGEIPAEWQHVYQSFSGIMGNEITSDEVIDLSTVNRAESGCMRVMKKYDSDMREYLRPAFLFNETKALVIDGNTLIRADVHHGVTMAFYTMNCLINDQGQMIGGYVQSQESDWTSLAVGPNRRRFHYIEDGLVMEWSQ